MTIYKRLCTKSCYWFISSECI